MVFRCFLGKDAKQGKVRSKKTNQIRPYIIYLLIFNLLAAMGLEPMTERI